MDLKRNPWTMAVRMEEWMYLGITKGSERVGKGRKGSERFGKGPFT